MHSYLVNYLPIITKTNLNRCLGKPELEEHFKSLKTLQVQFANVANSQEKDQEEVRRLRELNARYEGEVASFRERETLKANVKTLEKKKAWMVYQEENKRYQEANKTATELKEAYESAAASFQPLEQKIARQERAVSKTQEGQRAKVSHFCSPIPTYWS